MKLENILPRLRGLIVNDNRMVYEQDVLDLLSPTDEQDWQFIRNQAAIAVMKAMISTGEGAYSFSRQKDDIAKAAVEYADALIKELKKE